MRLLIGNTLYYLLYNYNNKLIYFVSIFTNKNRVIFLKKWLYINISSLYLFIKKMVPYKA